MSGYRASCVLLCFVAAVLSARAGNIPAVQSIPITFEANRGQAPAQYAYVFHRDGLRALFWRDGVDFDLVRSRGPAEKVRLTLVHGDAVPQARGALDGHSSYFTGNDASQWIRNVPLTREVEYSDVYPGISLRFYGNGRELEHDFRVEAGADPSRIAMRLAGADRVTLSASGDLEIRAGGDVLTLRRPVAYQQSERGRESVDARFLLAKDGTVRFEIGRYHRGLPLVIDPVFVFSTYLAGTGTDRPTAMTTDASGNIYVAGYTTSTDFPVQNPAQGKMGGCTSACENAFITKLDPTGTKLIYSTYLGGSSKDFADAITVDRNGNAIVAGYANSSDFPHAGAIAEPSSCDGTTCFFLTSLAPDGSALNYSGTVGGRSQVSDPSNSPFGPGLPLAVDGSGNAYLASVTQDPQFQITSGTLSATIVGYGYPEMFVLKVDASGRLIYSTVVPGNATYDASEAYINVFTPTGIAVDEAGDVATVGLAGMGLPTTAGVVAPQFPNDPSGENASAGFVLQLNAAASAINLASYLPGTDEADGLAVDGQGNYWIVGTTKETTLPVGQNAYMRAPTTGSYAGVATTGFVLELAPDATTVLNATYLDGSGTGQIWEASTFTAVALDSESNVYVGGGTSSADFPLQNPLVTMDVTGGGGQNLILAELSPDLAALKLGSFLSPADPGDGGSTFGGMAIDGSDNLIVTGSAAEGFPTTGGSFQQQPPAETTSSTSAAHGFVSKIAMTPAPSLCLSPAAGISFGNVPVNSSSSQSFTVKNCGNATLNMYTATVNDANVAVTLNCGAVPPGGFCSGTLTFKPLAAGQLSGWLNFGDNAMTIPQAIYWSGYASGDPSINAMPMLGGISPGFTGTGGGGPVLTVTGTGFTPSSTVYWGSTALSTQFLSAEQVTASAVAANVANAGVATITVKNPSPGGGTSNAMQFEVDSAGNGVSAPVFTQTQVTVAPRGSASYGVTLPSTATNISAKCLNLPQGATCSYSGGTVTIATSTSTPGGTYQITVVFAETLPVAAGAAVLPFLLLPLARIRRRSVKWVWLTASLGLAIGVAVVGCGGGGGSSNPGGSNGSGGSSTQTVTSSGTVTLVVR